VVPDYPGHVDLLLQVFVPLAGVQPVLVGSPDFHFNFQRAIYRTHVLIILRLVE